MREVMYWADWRLTLNISSCALTKFGRCGQFPATSWHLSRLITCKRCAGITPPVQRLPIFAAAPSFMAGRSALEDLARNGDNMSHARRPFLPQARQNSLVSRSFLRRNVVLIVSALALILAACGGSDDAGLSAPVAEVDEPELLEPAEGRDVTNDDELLAEGNDITVAEPLPEISGEPTAPSGLTVVSTGEGTINIEWDASREDGISRYEVLRSAAGGGTTTVEVNGTSYSDTGLTDGDIFSYRVIALRDNERSDLSEAVTAQVGVDTNPPRRPGRPEISETASGQVLTWAPTEDVSGIGGYILTREVDGTVVNLDAGTETSFRDDLPAGVVATYEVIAFDRVGNASEPSRNTTILTGRPADNVVIVVSEQGEAGNTFATSRLERELLDAGYTISWFEDGEFDSNVTTRDDLVLLLGDVKGDGFDWNIFFTDATVVGLKASFIQAGGILDTPPKLDRISAVTYDSPTSEPRTVTTSTLAEPNPVVFLPENEQIPDLQVWMRPSFSSTSAIAGIIAQGGVLASGDEAPGCRAFYPGNNESLAQTTAEGYALLVDFVDDVRTACG